MTSGGYSRVDANEEDLKEYIDYRPPKRRYCSFLLILLFCSTVPLVISFLYDGTQPQDQKSTRPQKLRALIGIPFHTNSRGDDRLGTLQRNLQNLKSMKTFKIYTLVVSNINITGDTRKLINHFFVYDNQGDRLAHPWWVLEQMKKKKKKYDLFGYMEDDVLMPAKTFSFWVQTSKQLWEENFILGFYRVENRSNILSEAGPRLGRIVHTNQGKFVHLTNFYSATWLMWKSQFENYTKSICATRETAVTPYMPREAAGSGMHCKPNQGPEVIVHPLHSYVFHEIPTHKYKKGIGGQYLVGHLLQLYWFEQHIRISDWTRNSRVIIEPY